MLTKSFRSFHIKYLFLLVLSVVPFASAQDTKLPPDLKLSEGSKLDKSQPDIYRMRIGKLSFFRFGIFSLHRAHCLLSLNPFPDIRRTLAKIYAPPFLVSEEADHVEINQCQFTQIQFDHPGFRISDQLAQFVKMLRINPSH